jgi:hypothetical protein
VTIAKRPSCGGGTAKDSPILGSEKAKYFLREGWTSPFLRHELICPTGSAHWWLVLEQGATRALKDYPRKTAFMREVQA